MRLALTIYFILFIVFISFAQVPGTKWSKYINNFSSRSVFFDIKNTRDKGFIAAGTDSGLISKTSIINEWAKGKPWIAKLDSNGNQVWSRYQSRNAFRGDLNGAFLSVQQTDDQGYVAAGYTGQLALGSFGGDPSNADADVYVAKYSVDGVLQWEKIFGGANSGGSDDRAMSVQEANGNGFIIAGFTASLDGDVVGNHSNFDAWLLRLDKNGNVIWKKCYGGTGSDSAYAILQTPDKGFIVAGSSTSSNGDLNANFGATDAWVFKIDSLGNLLWQRNYGGTGNEAFKGITLNSDGTYTFIGYSSSTNISGTTNTGKNDVWVVKTTLDGQVIWSKLFGGTADEQGFSVAATPEGNNLISGYTESNDGMVNGNNGGADAWLLKLDASGNLIWQRCIGASIDDGALSCISLTERDFIIAGFGQPSPGIGISGYVARLGNTNTVQGTVFIDDNNNGIWDANEKGFNEGLITIAGGINNSNISIIPQNGLFSIDLGNIGIYTATLQISNPYYTALTTTYNFSFSAYFDTVRFIDFPVRPIVNKKDLVINLVALSRARPGYDGAIRIMYKNVGTTTISSGEILLAKDPRAHYNYAYPAITTSVGDSLKWTYTSLAPGDSASIVLVQHFDIPPALNAGDTLKYMAIISPVAADETPQNDTASLKLIAVNSLDPNDKTENNGGIIGSDYITQGKYLNYTIRFQNTGTDTAFNVIVRDTLDSKLDWSTFEMVAASHPYTVSITNQNKLEWSFADINLPDSNINEPLSHGYLSYRVKPKSTAAVGDVINNLASIYFDYNLPVATNNAITLVQDKFTALPLQLLSFTGQLTNNTVQLSWNTANETAFKTFEVERSVDGALFNKIASVAFAGSVHNYGATDNVSALSSKHIYYRLKLVDADGKFTYSKVVVFNIAASQNRFSVYPNPANTEIFVSITTDRKSNLQIRIVDASGRVVSEAQKVIDKGNYVFPVNTSRLKKGNYTLQIVGGDEMMTSKFIIAN